MRLLGGCATIARSGSARARGLCDPRCVPPSGLLSWLAFAVSIAPATAWAHGGPPTFEHVAVDPADPSRMLARTNFGVLASRDGGATWAWICPGAVSLRIDVEDPIVGFAGDGAGLVGDLAGLFRSDREHCDWTRPAPELTEVRVAAIARGPAGDILAGTSEEGAANALFRSGDDGLTWSPIHGPTPDVWYESIAVAPSDPRWIYAVHNRPPLRAEPWDITVLRTDDGGSTWQQVSFDHVEHEWRLYVLAVDPTNPQRALARTQNLYPREAERLVLTEDGGRTWRDVLRMTQILSATYSADGRTAWVGGPVDGLHRSDDGGRSFVQVSTPSVRCIVMVGEELWICGDDFTDGFALGRSFDGGATFEGVASLRSIGGVLACPAGTTVQRICPGERATLDAILAMAPGGPRPQDAGPASDAGSANDGAPANDAGSASDARSDSDAAGDAAPASPPAPSCGCRAGSAATSMLAILFLLGVTGLAWRSHVRA